MPSPCKGIGQITAPPRPATISDERAVPLKAEFLTFVVQGDTAVSLHYTTPEPDPWYLVWMNKTILPSALAVVSYTVPQACESPGSA